MRDKSSREGHPLLELFNSVLMVLIITIFQDVPIIA